MDHVDKSTTTSSGDPDIDAYLSIKSSGSSTSTTELSNDSVGRTKRRSISLGNLIFELPENWKQIKEEKRRRKEEEDEKKRKSLKKAISQKDKFLVEMDLLDEVKIVVEEINFDYVKPIPKDPDEDPCDKPCARFCVRICCC